MTQKIQLTRTRETRRFGVYEFEVDGLAQKIYLGKGLPVKLTMTLEEVTDEPQ